MMITSTIATVFNTSAAAEAAVLLMGFDDGECRVIVDPKGSGRCIIEIIDLEDGAVIGRV